VANVCASKAAIIDLSSLDIQQYDVALKAVTISSATIANLMSQMLAFSESEIAACNGIATLDLLRLRRQRL